MYILLHLAISLLIYMASFTFVAMGGIALIDKLGAYLLQKN